MLRQAQPRRRGRDMRGAGIFGGDSQADPGRRALTRLISASLRSCRALSKPNAFPPAGDKEAAREAGGGVSPGRAPRTPPSGRRAQVAGGRGDSAPGWGGWGRGAGQRGDGGAYLGTCC